MSPGRAATVNLRLDGAVRGGGARRGGVTRPRTAAIAVVVALVAGAAGAGWFLLRDDEPALPRREVAAYLAAWERFDVAGMRALIAAPPPELDAAVSGMQADLQVTTAPVAPGLVRRQGDVVIADFNAELTLAGLGVWIYPGTLQLARTGGKWLV